VATNFFDGKKVHADADNGSEIIRNVQVPNPGRAVDDDEIQIDQFPDIDEDDSLQHTATKECNINEV